jgi:membrane protease YdiL (CAAX protease family)
VHVVFFNTFGPFAALAAVFIASAILLVLTPGFRWFELIDCRGLLGHIPMTVILIAPCTAVTFALALLVVPERFISFPRYSFDRYLVVIALYPFLSVLGQAIAYRLLLYRRYGALFANWSAGIFVSAFIFALADAFYMNWIAVILSFAGGLFFAWGYERTRSFMLV